MFAARVAIGSMPSEYSTAALAASSRDGHVYVSTIVMAAAERALAGRGRCAGGCVAACKGGSADRNAGLEGEQHVHQDQHHGAERPSQPCLVIPFGAEFQLLDHQLGVHARRGQGKDYLDDAGHLQDSDTRHKSALGECLHKRRMFIVSIHAHT